VDPTDAAGYSAITGWGVIYADANAGEPPAGTVRVELKNLETYVWSISQTKWLRVQATVQVTGGHYFEDFANNASIDPDWQTEPDGGISSGMVTGYNLHIFPSSRSAVTASDIGGVYVTYDARLIGANAGSARYLADAGADWWQTTTAPYPGNTGVGMGRYTYLAPNWTAIDFYTGGVYGPAAYPPAWTAAQLAASNPPIDAMGAP
jgi:hypothetical protein